MINIFRHIRNRRERKLRERCLRYSIKVNEGRADKYQIIWYADRCYDFITRKAKSFLRCTTGKAYRIYRKDKTMDSKYTDIENRVRFLEHLTGFLGVVIALLSIALLLSVWCR